MFEKKDQVKKFLKFMNPRHHNNKFTCEEEVTWIYLSQKISNNKLVTCCNQENIQWCLYEFQQFLPVAYEKSLNDTFLFCGYNIFSDCTTLHHEI